MGVSFDEVLQATRNSGMSQTLMVNRLMQLYRVPRTLDGLKRFINRADILFIVKALPFFLALIVVLAGQLIETSIVKYIRVRDDGFMFDYKGVPRELSWVGNFERFVSYNVTDAPWNLVISSIIAITSEVTTTGAKYLGSNRNIMIIIISTGTFLGTVFTTYCAVRVISSRCTVNEALATYRDSLSDLNLFMKKEKIDKNICLEVSQYFAYVWEKTAGTDCRTVLQLCDQISLRTDAILHVYGQTFSKCPILNDCDVSMLRILGRAVSGLYFRKGMVIIERDDIVSDLFFVDTGTLDMRLPDDDKQVLTQLPRGSVFGNLDNVWAQVCPNRFVACTNTHVLKINSTIFHSVIHDFPTVRILLNTYRPRNQNYIIGGAQVKGKIATVWKDRIQDVQAVKEEGNKTVTYNSYVIQIYVIIISLACVLGDIYNAGFQVNNRMLVGILYLLDFCFVIKILMHYSMPYINDDEVDKKAATELAKKKYCSTEFRCDILTCLPIELFCMLSNTPWSIFAYLRLNRCFRIVTVHSCLRRYHENLNVNVTISSIVEVFIRFVLYSHISTCIWYHIGYLEDKQEPGSSWCFKKTGEKICVQNLYFISQDYVMSIITLSAQNDIYAKTLPEVTFVAIFMIVALIMYLVFMGEFAHIIHYRSYRCFNYYSKYLELQQYLDSNRVSWNLKKMSRDYSLYLWREARGMQTPKFLLEAPQILKEKIMSAVYMVHIANHPVFSQCEPAFLRQLVTYFKPYYYSEDFYVVKEGEMSGAMYFIHQGKVQELDEDMQEKLIIYEKYQHFGTLQGLYNEVAYTLSYKTLVRSQVLTLYLSDWQHLLDYYPISKEIIYPPKTPPPPPQFYTHVPKSVIDDEDKDKKKVQITRDPDEVKQFTRESRMNLDDAEGGANLYPELEEAATENLGPGSEDTSPFPAVKFRAKHASPKPFYTPLADQAPASQTEEAVDLNQWPMDSRKSTIHPFTREEKKEPNLDDLTRDILSVPSADFDIYKSTPQPSSAKTVSMLPATSKPKSSEPEEEEPPKVDYGRRKSMVHAVDKEAVAKELASITSAQDLEPKSAESEEEEPPKVDYGRRKSMIHAVDKAAVAKELASITSAEDLKPKSAESEEEEPPKVNYGRRKSMVHAVDKEAVARELASISAQDLDPSGRPGASEEMELKKIPYSEEETDEKQPELVTSGLSTPKFDVHLAPPGERPSGETYSSFKSDVTTPENKKSLSNYQVKSSSAEREKLMNLGDEQEKRVALSDIAERVSLTMEHEKPVHSKTKHNILTEHKTADMLPPGEVSKEHRGDQPSTSIEKRPRTGLAFDKSVKTKAESDEDAVDTEASSHMRAKTTRAQSIWGVEDFIMEDEDEDENNKKKDDKKFTDKFLNKDDNVQKKVDKKFTDIFLNKDDNVQKKADKKFTDIFHKKDGKKLTDFFRKDDKGQKDDKVEKDDDMDKGEKDDNKDDKGEKDNKGQKDVKKFTDIFRKKK